jgi:hypothetical protein
MQRLRASIRDHRHLALLALALAFLVRAALPAGYMVSLDASSAITIAVCSDASGAHKTTQLVIPAKPGKPSGQAGKDGSCAFSAMAKSALGGADPILLALAFAFILVLGLAPSRALRARPVPHTLPPLRGPPALA